LDSAGYSLDQKIFKEGKGLTPQEMAQKLFEEESIRQVLTSLVVCLFARNVYTLERVEKCLRLLGWGWNEAQLLETGKKILMEKNQLKREMGFDIEKFEIPGRVLKVPTPLGSIEAGYLRETVKHFKMYLGV
jgi:aldehyde:ferredoxin oxidoreductase